MEEKEKQHRNYQQTKKNPYIMTIGFDRTNPRHVEVADFLNSLQRKKAQYIVDAVRSYQNPKEEETISAISGVDYHHIRSMVLQILKEQEHMAGGENMESERTDNEMSDMEEEELNGILSSIRAFRR